MLGYNKNIASLIQHTSTNQTFRIKSSTQWTEQEDNILIHLHNIHGSNWDLISRHLSSSLNESNDYGLDRSPTEVRRRYEKVIRPYNPFADKENDPVSLINGLATFNYKTKFKLEQPSQRKACPVPATYGLKSLKPTNGTTLKLKLSDPLDLQASSIKQRKLNSDNCDSTRPNIITCLPLTHPSSPSFRAPKEMLVNTKLTNHKAGLFTACVNSSTVPATQEQQQTRSPQIINRSRSHKYDSPSAATTTTAIAPITGHQVAPVATTVESSFLVQTPTKALSEADQFSFHLASPPAVLGVNLVTGTNPSNRAMKSIKTEPNKTPVKRLLTQDTKSLTGRPTLCTRLFDSPSSDVMTNPTITKSSTLPASLTSSSSNYSKSLYTSSSLRLTKPNDSKCLALLTAKATVWNRVLSSISTSDRSLFANSKPLNSMAGSSSSGDGSSNLTNSLFGTARRYHGSDLFFGERSSYNNDSHMISNSQVRLREPLKPLTPLAMPSRQQPNLALRRVLQVGYETNWRELALGHNRACLNVIRSARLFMDEFNSVRDNSQEFARVNPECSQQTTTSNRSSTPNCKKDFIKPEPS